MEGRITCGLWLLVLLLGCGRLAAFNLDTDNVLRRDGEKGSLFGFSVAMHRQLEPEDKTMLLVGAPKAKALSRHMSKVTGGLYSCAMNPPSAGCNRVIFDNNENLKEESKENQWMGVSVSSQGPGGKIVTCAHRYQKRLNVKKPSEIRYITGRCYTMSQDLTIQDTSDGDGGEWKFCEGRGQNHETFGSCQQGISTTYDKDYHYIIFGAPGTYNWKGMVRLEQRNDSFISLNIFNDGPYEMEVAQIPDNSYLGFSLDSGKSLTKKGQLTVVAGAPRAPHSGAVKLLKIDEKTKDNFEQKMAEEYSLEGEGLASSFGYDVTVLDLNKDGWEDIVVGAPQYFEKDGEIGGAVYVYINKAGKWNKVTPTRIDGPQDSMFGLVVQSLGDINQDGYHDFAVGAPYDDDGAGNVFIYHGSAEGLSSKKAAQVLSGNSLGVKLFGYSLAGNMDLDKNSYPDLAVGSLSDAVFVYRARPVINIDKKITFSPKEIDLTKKNCGNAFCLEVEACFTYSARPDSYTPRLEVQYSLEADVERRESGLLSRATFTPGSSHTLQGTIVMNTKGKEECIKRKLTIQENIKDKLHGIPIKVSVDIQESKRKRRQSSTELSPVLDAREAPTLSIVQFLKEGCGGDVCHSKLKVRHRYGHNPTAGQKFTELPKKDDSVPVISLSDQRDIALEVTVTNEGGDDAHEASLLASFPRSLTYSSFRGPTDVTCIGNTDGSQANCDLGNPFKRDAVTTFYIILSTSGISPNTTELEIDLQLNTTSDQTIAPVKAKAKVTIRLQLSVTGQAQPSQVYFTGKVKGDDAIKSENEIGSAIVHQFRIINLGKRLTDSTATLEIEWPKETEQGKWLLYLTKISSTGLNKIQCSPKAEINPRNKELSNTRRRREAEKTQGSVEGTLSRLIAPNDAKTLSCGEGAKCVRISCPLQGLDSNAVINLYSRLWNSTFLEDFPALHHVKVIVNASLHVDSTAKNTELQNAVAQVSLTAFPERREAIHGSVPWWIIVLSILFGLLLLGLLAFLLWKCGFFKRAKYEEKVPSYSAVRIKVEERAINPGNGNWENLEKKPWITTWHNKEHYS